MSRFSPRLDAIEVALQGPFKDGGKKELDEILFRGSELNAHQKLKLQLCIAGKFS